MIQAIIDRLDWLFSNHPMVKSVWRTAVIVTAAAIAKELGYDGFISDIAGEL